MKKYVGITLLLALTFGATAIQAEDETGAALLESQREQIKQTQEKNIENKKQQLEAEREQAKQDQENIKKDQEQLKDARKQLEERRMNLFKDMAVKRIAFAMAQIDNITKRIESYTAKLKAAGVDTTTADAKLAAVQTAVTDAKVKIEAFKKAMLAKIESTGTPANTTELSAMKKSAEDAIKAARTALGDALKALKTYKLPAKAQKTDATTPTN